MKPASCAKCCCCMMDVTAAYCRFSWWMDAFSSPSVPTVARQGNRTACRSLPSKTMLHDSDALFTRVAQGSPFIWELVAKGGLRVEGRPVSVLPPMAWWYELVSELSSMTISPACCVASSFILVPTHQRLHDFVHTTPESTAFVLHRLSSLTEPLSVITIIASNTR